MSVIVFLYDCGYELLFELICFLLFNTLFFIVPAFFRLLFAVAIVIRISKFFFFGVIDYLKNGRKNNKNFHFFRILLVMRFFIFYYLFVKESGNYAWKSFVF